MPLHHTHASFLATRWIWVTAMTEPTIAYYTGKVCHSLCTETPKFGLQTWTTTGSSWLALVWRLKPTVSNYNAYLTFCLFLLSDFLSERFTVWYRPLFSLVDRTVCGSVTLNVTTLKTQEAGCKNYPNLKRGSGFTWNLFSKVLET